MAIENTWCIFADCFFLISYNIFACGIKNISRSTHKPIIETSISITLAMVNSNMFFIFFLFM